LSRNAKIERIIEEWYESDTCPLGQRSELRKKRDETISEYFEGTSFTVDQVLNSLHSQYQDYRRERWKNERLAGGQQAPKS
jgi:hypothetical protein